MVNFKYNSFKSAFTLIETIVVITIFTIVSLTLSDSIINFYQTNDYAVRQSAAISNGRIAMTKLIADLREMTLSDNGEYPISDISENTIDFYSDIDLDKSVELVKYYVNAEDQMLKEVYEFNGTVYALDQTITVADYIRNSTYVRDAVVGVDIFTYYDSEGVVVTNLDDLDAVKYIKVEVIVNVDPQKQPEEFILYSSANLRNLPVIE